MSAGILSHLGVNTLLSAPRDVHLLLMQRSFRMYAYGSSTLVFVLFFNALGFSDASIGSFMTLTLFGDVLISLLLTLVADKFGRKKVLTIGAVMMIGSGIVFTMSSNYYVLLLAAIVGIISPSGNEIGPFRSVEDSVLAHLNAPERRADVFALSGLIGSASSAAGLLCGGWITQRLQSTFLWTPLASYRAIFVLYSMCAVGKLVLTLSLSDVCEMDSFIESRQRHASGDREAEIALLDATESEVPVPPVKPTRRVSRISKGLSALVPPLSAESWRTLIKFSMLRSLDSLATGLVPFSFIVYFFSQKFLLSPGTLGNIFFTTRLVSAFSNLGAAAISKSIGLIKTMVFTHLPAAVFLSLIPFAPNLYLAIAFLVCRNCTGSMNMAPRSAFVSQMVKKEERTAVLGLLNVVKTVSQAMGPWITGRLSQTGLLWASFVVAGAMKATYDLLMLYMFVNFQPPDGGAA